MSNPGPAVTTSIHPQVLGSNQALRVIATIKGLSVGKLGDTAVAVIDTAYYVPTSVIITNASVDVHSVALGVYTATGGAGGSGSAILSTAALTSNTSSAYATVSAATQANTRDLAKWHVDYAAHSQRGLVRPTVHGEGLCGQTQLSKKFCPS